jgi:L,D-peptidoglycan transpeptidase YkuD (ErfK/YbiS/YcfS/YnhG family)
LFWVAAATTFVAAAALVVLIARGRAEAADLTARRAVDALGAARQAGAADWAGEELAAAELAIREAMIEQRRQDVRWWLPDYSVAERHWRAAATAAGAAASSADVRRANAMAGADASIAAADEAVAASTRRSASIYAGTDGFAMLAEARLRLDEARVHRRTGDFTQAAASADQAYALTQHMDARTSDAVRRYADARVQRTWQQWKTETIAWSRRQRRAAVVVAKEEHTVTLYVNGRVRRVYQADLGFNWVADKLLAGDGATPEGRYRVAQVKRGGATLYYKALLLNYPNDLDRREFQAAKRSGQAPPGATIGGLIEIHGEGGRDQDWTKGCIALRNRDIDELMRFVGNGTPVTIIGSDGANALASLAAEPRPKGLGR